MKEVEKNEQLDIINTILNNENAFYTYINSIEKDIDIKTLKSNFKQAGIEYFK